MMFSLSFVGGGGGSKSAEGGPNRWDTVVGKRIVMFKGFFANIGGKFISHQN